MLEIKVSESKLNVKNFLQIEDIVSVCAKLIIIDEKSEIVWLVYYIT